MRQVWKVMAASGTMGWAMLLAVLVVLAGAGLLMLSGWFISAAAVAGLAGYAGGAVIFDVFRPAAAVRGLALIRTATRYGERILGHDATLRAVADLRGKVLSGLAGRPWRSLLQLRRGPALARVVADTDTLDGLPLRIVLPGLAGIAAILFVLVVTGWLAGWWLAVWICGCHALAALAAAVWGGRQAMRIAAPLDAAEQDFRTHALDLVAARDDLRVYGRIDRQLWLAAGAEARAQALMRAQEGAERGIALMQEIGRLAAMAGALVLGGRGVAEGQLDPALVALCFLAAMALAEAVAPLRRAVAEWGRIRNAAARVAPMLDSPPPPREGRAPQGRSLVIDGIEVAPGEILGLSGRSGAGKSTLLARIAGLLPADGHAIALGGRPVADWPEADLRVALTLVPQRTALIAGTLRENLSLAAPRANDDEMRAALASMRLDHLPGGLDLRLADGGAPLSGGEARRVALARAILRRPAVLLLDEPTEGMDDALANEIRAAIRLFSCNIPLVIASHRRCDHATARYVIDLK